MRGTRLIIGVLCVGLLAAASGTATTQHPTQQPTLQTGDLADTCENATVIESGVYNGTLSPGDTDVFRVEAIGEGSYIAFNLSFEGGADAIEMEAYENEDEYAAAIFGSSHRS
ncbi:hypothetical protein [Natrinema sp. SYSU A 869]|uniref:hypothetical protein n=1 Tax=Natrinema sp. SYSU A 869 TaxID=2871694 RepID=UPI001CA3B2C7|nr:hypothetical protein [Natrinema sp. SYSU A 869]